MYCNKCGKEIGVKVRFCPYCGSETKSVQSPQNGGKAQRVSAKPFGLRVSERLKALDFVGQLLKTPEILILIVLILLFPLFFLYPLLIRIFTGSSFGQQAVGLPAEVSTDISFDTPLVNTASDVEVLKTMALGADGANATMLSVSVAVGLIAFIICAMVLWVYEIGWVFQGHSELRIPTPAIFMSIAAFAIAFAIKNGIGLIPTDIQQMVEAFFWFPYFLLIYVAVLLGLLAFRNFRMRRNQSDQRTRGGKAFVPAGIAMAAVSSLIFGTPLLVAGAENPFLQDGATFLGIACIMPFSLDSMAVLLSILTGLLYAAMIVLGILLIRKNLQNRASGVCGICFSAAAILTMATLVMAVKAINDLLRAGGLAPSTDALMDPLQPHWIMLIIGLLSAVLSLVISIQNGFRSISKESGRQNEEKNP